MSEQIQRARLLVQQGRYEMAQEILVQILANNPDDAVAHTLLATCFLGQNELTEATREAQAVIHLRPDIAEGHHLLGIILLERNRYAEAEQALRESLRLDPYSSDTYGYLSRLHFEQRQWQKAVECAQQGLEIDPDDSLCENMLSLALERTGQTGVAIDRSRETLSKNPDDSYSHATLGWALLNDGQYKEAQDSFREALRLDPTNEFAQGGMVQALNSNNLLFRLMFKWYSFMGRLSGSIQWAIIIGLYFVNRILNSLAAQNPALKPFVLPITILYLGFALMTWIANPIFNTFLRFNSYGKYLLSKREKMASNFVIGMLLFGVITGIAAAVLIEPIFALLCVAYAMIMIIPISGTFNCSEGWPFIVMAVVTVALGVLGLFILLLAALGLELAVTLVPVFIFGNIGAQFLANYLANVTVQE